MNDHDFEILKKINDRGGRFLQTASKRAGKKKRGYPIVSLGALARKGYIVVRSIGVRTWRMNNHPSQFIFNDGDFVECYITADGKKALKDYLESKNGC